MVVADVETIQAFFQDIDQDRMTVPQVENATVGMEVEKLFRAALVVKKRAVALAHDEIHPELTEKRHFTGGNMGFESLDGLFSFHRGCSRCAAG
jgi:purine-nucleoside phosphorylase